MKKSSHFFGKKNISTTDFLCTKSLNEFLTNELLQCFKQLGPCPEVIKLVSCSTQLSMKFFLLISVEMPTTVGISTFMSRKNNILDLSEPKKC